jgi:hypothetical protein
LAQTKLAGDAAAILHRLGVPLDGREAPDIHN